MISVQDVCKSYDGKQVLAPTSLDIPAGVAHVLVGQSGSGKSTLLRIVMELIAPDRGSVRIDSELLVRENARRIRHGIGYVIQDGGLFPHLTAAENIALLARHLGWEEKRIGVRLSELSELARFPADGLQRYPLQLSGGQRQRVGVMRALMLDPPVLLMDEPLGALDPLIRVRLQEDLKAIFQRLNKTVLIVTHDMGEAAYLGDAISVMRDGRILQTGRVGELLHSPADPYVSDLISAQRPRALEEATGE